MDTCEGCDVVRDICKEESVKAHTKTTQGVAELLGLQGDTELPCHFSEIPLFHYLTSELSKARL